MNCTELISRMGFECEAVGARTLRVYSPFTYPFDGEHVGLYVQQNGDNYRVTDNAESLFHASSFGIKISKKRLETLRTICGPTVSISDGGEITATGEEYKVGGMLTAVLNATLAVSHMEPSWMPRSRNAEFTEEVAEIISNVVGERMHRNERVTGASGHQLEIPIVIDVSTGRRFVQPIAYGTDRIDWDNVYRGFGKMMDLKNAGADDEARTVVIEDTYRDTEIPKAVTLLANCANVVYFSNLHGWLERLVA